MTSNSGVDVLFEQNAISEIIKIESKIRHDIEKKKAELRQMVGERYMDIIEAADTVDSMEKEANAIPSYIEALKKRCRDLQRLGSNLDNVQQHSNSDNHLDVYATVRFLTDVPSHLWLLLFKNQPLSAAVLWRVSERAYYYCISSKIKDTVSSVVNQQWTIIADLKKVIEQYAEKQVIVPYISGNSLFSYVCVQMLLDNTALDKTVRSFFVALNEFVLRTFQREDRAAKDNVVDLLSIFRCSVIAIFEVFVQSSQTEQPLFQLQFPKSVVLALSGIVDNPAESYVRCLPKDYLVLLKILESDISITPELIAVVKKLCVEFSEFFESACKEHLTPALRYVSSCKSLSSIYSTLKNISEQDSERWYLVTEILSINLVDVFGKLFRDALCDRCGSLVLEQATSASSQLISDLRNLLSSLQESSANQSQTDFEAECKSIASRFDLRLKETLEDCDIFIQASKDEAESRTAIKASLLRAAEGCVKDLATFAQLLIDQHQNHMTYCILYKMCSLVCEKCPTLWRYVDPNTADSERLHSIVTDYKDLSAIHCISHIIVQSAGDLEQTLMRSCANTEGTVKFMLSATLTWTEADIEEETESGTVEKTTIRYPSHPSIALHSTVFKICDQVRLTFGYLLPHNVIRECNQVLVKTCLMLYKKLEPVQNSSAVSKADSNFSGLMQRWALQLLFDVKWLFAVCSPPAMPDITETYKDVISALESHIDPFDLDVFQPHIDKAVRTAVHATSLLYGVMLPDAVTSVGSAHSIKSLEGFGSNNQVILMGAVGLPRFPLLPSVQMLSPISGRSGAGNVASAASASLSGSSVVSKQETSTGSSRSIDALSLSSAANISSSIYQKMTNMSSSWFNV